MAEQEIQGINTIRVKPASEDVTVVFPTEACTNQNAVQQKISPKYEKITQMFLARPANATADISEVNTPKQDAPDRNNEEVKIRKAKEYDVFPQENGPKVEEEEQKLKAKYEAIAQMFLARPATYPDQIREYTKVKKKEKKREVDKKIGKKDKQSKPSRLAGCFSFIVEWFSKKKQKRQDKKLKRKGSKYRKEKSVRFCELPPDIKIYDSDECVDADEGDVCKFDDVDFLFI